MRLRFALTTFLFVLLGLCVPKAHAQTPTLAWSSSCPNSGSVISPFSTAPDYRCGAAEPTTAGDVLVVRFCYDNTSNDQVFVISDDKGDSFNSVVSSATGNGKQCEVYVAANVASGATSVNLHKTSGGSSGYWQVTWAEYYNIPASSPVDASSCNTGYSATLTAGNITPTVSGDLIDQFTYSSNYNGQSSFTLGSQSNITWAWLFQGLGDGAAAQYGIYNSTATINPTFTQPGTNFFISCAVALEARSLRECPDRMAAHRSLASRCDAKSRSESLVHRDGVDSRFGWRSIHDVSRQRRSRSRRSNHRFPVANCKLDGQWRGRDRTERPQPFRHLCS